MQWQVWTAFGTMEGIDVSSQYSRYYHLEDMHVSLRHLSDSAISLVTEWVWPSVV